NCHEGIFARVCALPGAAAAVARSVPRLAVSASMGWDHSGLPEGSVLCSSAATSDLRRRRSAPAAAESLRTLVRVLYLLGSYRVMFVAARHLFRLREDPNCLLR